MLGQLSRESIGQGVTGPCQHPLEKLRVFFFPTFNSEWIQSQHCLVPFWVKGRKITCILSFSKSFQLYLESARSLLGWNQERGLISDSKGKGGDISKYCHEICLQGMIKSVELTSYGFTCVSVFMHPSECYCMCVFRA